MTFDQGKESTRFREQNILNSIAGFDAKDARGGRKDLGKVLSVKKI